MRDDPLPLTDDILRKMFDQNAKSREPLSMEIPPPPLGAPSTMQIDEKEMKKTLSKMRGSNTPDLSGWCMDLIVIIYEDAALVCNP